MAHYTSLVDLLNVLKATMISSGIVVLAVLFIYGFEGFPRSVFILDWILTFLFIVGARVVIRLLLSERERGFQTLFRRPFYSSGDGKPQKRLLIIGAGDAGEKILRDMMKQGVDHFLPVGFLDDDLMKAGGVHPRGQGPGRYE